MLRDQPRNACYAGAIAHAVRPGMRLLEIGTGAKLLALLAARAEVTTCESDPVMAAAAREAVARNGCADRVRVVAKRFTALEIDIDAPCDLLVSELFRSDAALALQIDFEDAPGGALRERVAGLRRRPDRRGGAPAPPRFRRRRDPRERVSRQPVGALGDARPRLRRSDRRRARTDGEVEARVFRDTRLTIALA